MKSSTSMLQTILLVIFGLGIVIAVILLSGNIDIGGSQKTEGPSGNILVWGVLSRASMEPFFDYIESQNKGLSVTYIEKSAESLQVDLVNALASGKGPDIFMIPPGQVAENIDRLSIIPFSLISKTVFQSTFTDIGESLLVPQGFLAFPAFIDPMVMYYNRDMLTSIFKTDAPKTWNELDQLIPLLVKRNDAGVIQQAAVALGSGNNITHSDSVLYTRFLQDKNPIISFSNSNKWFSDIGNGLSEKITWFTQYAQPSNPLYSWNESLPQDKDMFIASRLAFYFGYASELEGIRQKNPNLNFRISMIPQLDNSSYKASYGQLYSIGVSKISSNLQSAIQLASIMIQKESLEYILAQTYYVPTRKDMYTNRPIDNPERAMLLDAGVITRTFLNPSITETRRILTTNINQLNSGVRSFSEAINSINVGFRDLTNKIVIPE